MGQSRYTRPHAQPGDPLDLDKLRTVALSDACEDYQGLYELVWYLNGREPSTPRADKVAAASAVLQDLLRTGHISLYTSVWAEGEFQPVPPEKQLAIAADPASYADPPQPPAKYVSYASTPEGEQVYRSLPESAFEGLW